jgi:integrase
MARQGKETGSKARITKRAVDALRARAKDEGRTLYLRDDEVTGFGALCTKAGACSYFVEYRLGGRGTAQKRMTIGKHGVLTPEQARQRAKEELGKVARGDDVSQARKEKREKLTSLTFADAAKRYLDVREAEGETTEGYNRTKRARLLNSPDLKPVAGKPIALIKRADLTAVIDAAIIRSPSAALVLHSHLCTVFAWARSRSLIDVDPMDGFDAPAKPKERARKLTNEELGAVWQAAGELSWPWENIFKLLALTGQRRQEVAGMRWRELDLDAGEWTIAKERAKNGKAHTIDLHPAAVALLDPLGEAMAARVVRARAWTNEPDEIVFTTTGRTAVSGFSNAKERLDARMQEILGGKFQPWHTHDLRRTAATGMAALGSLPNVIERVLNHVSGAQGGLTGIYQQYEYRPERKAALLAWGDHLMRLVSGASESQGTSQGDTGESQGTSHAASNIVPLRRASRA